MSVTAALDALPLLGSSTATQLDPELELAELSDESGRDADADAAGSAVGNSAVASPADNEVRTCAELANQDEAWVFCESANVTFFALFRCGFNDPGRVHMSK